jgi:hypothetical protein
VSEPTNFTLSYRYDVLARDPKTHHDKQLAVDCQKFLGSPTIGERVTAILTLKQMVRDAGLEPVHGLHIPDSMARARFI